MYVVKLSREAPMEGIESNWAGDLVFVWHDDLALFKVVRRCDRAILRGKPGIYKSWFQLRFMLFCLRQDLHMHFLVRMSFPQGLLVKKAFGSDYEGSE